MNYVNAQSLAGTVANLNTARLQGTRLAQAEREQAAAWIAGRADLPGSYRGLPAPTAADHHAKLRLFTGEIVGSRVGVRCKLGFEATWALTALHPRKPAAAAVATACRQRTIECFAQERVRRPGMYCCCTCSVAGWRALGNAPEPAAAPLLEAALGCLRADRDGKGRWLHFPFWYSLLALSDMTHPRAIEELAYAAPRMERVLQAKVGRDIYDRRRRLLARHVLARVVAG